MSNGWLFLGIVTLVCIGTFISGLRFSRMTSNPWKDRYIGRFPVEGGDLSVSRIRLFGRFQMIVAPIFFLLFAALAFGLFGPVDGIQTIKIVSE